MGAELVAGSTVGIGVDLELSAVPGVAAPAPGQPQAFPTWAPSSGPTTVIRSGPVRLRTRTGRGVFSPLATLARHTAYAPAPYMTG